MPEPAELEPAAGGRPAHRSSTGKDSAWTGSAGDTDADPQAELLERLRRTPGLESLVTEAVATWRDRAAAAGEETEGTPGWRSFSDAFPTFWEFSNRPR